MHALKCGLAVIFCKEFEKMKKVKVLVNFYNYTIDISNDTDDESLIPRTMQVPCIFTKDITIQVQ